MTGADDAIERVASEVTADLRRTRRMRGVMRALTACLVALALLIALYGLVRAYGDQRDDTEQLTGEVTANDARSSCRVALGNVVTEAQSIFLLAIGDALLALASEEDDAFGKALADLRAARQPYSQAVAARLAYESDGAPPECPVQST